MRLPLLLEYGVVLLAAAACAGKSTGTTTPGASVLLDAQAPPVARGDATLNFSGCSYANAAISGPAGAPTTSDFGSTVVNGNALGGYRVACSVTYDGTYAVSAHIESPDMSLDVQSSDVNAGAQMTFYEAGLTGTQNALGSVDASDNLAPTCTLTVSGGKLQVSSGTIFAQYDCPTVRDPTNLASVCHTQGFFYFSDCST